MEVWKTFRWTTSLTSHWPTMQWHIWVYLMTRSCLYTLSSLASCIWAILVLMRAAMTAQVWTLSGHCCQSNLYLFIIISYTLSTRHNKRKTEKNKNKKYLRTQLVSSTYTKSNNVRLKENQREDISDQYTLLQHQREDISDQYTLLQQGKTC